MSRESKLAAGIVLVLVPTVMVGGAALLMHLVRELPGYRDNPLRQDLWRAGHAHAGVFLVLALVMLRYVDEARLGSGARAFARWSAPAAAILAPAGFFLSVVRPEATAPNAWIALVPLGAMVLAAGV